MALAFVLLVVFGGLGILVAIGNIVRGHIENATDGEPESINFAIAFWLFIVLGIWCNVDDKGIGFALFAICAVPLILFNVYQFFTK